MIVRADVPTRVSIDVPALATLGKRRGSRHQLELAARRGDRDCTGAAPSGETQISPANQFRSRYDRRAVDRHVRQSQHLFESFRVTNNRIPIRYDSGHLCLRHETFAGDACANQVAGLDGALDVRRRS